MFTEACRINLSVAREPARKRVKLTMKLSGCSFCSLQLLRKHEFCIKLSQKPILCIKLSRKPYILWWFVDPDTFVPGRYFRINKFSGLLNRPSVQERKSVPTLFVRINKISRLSEPGLTNHHCTVYMLITKKINRLEGPMKKIILLPFCQKKTSARTKSPPPPPSE